ncbi:MAG: hypothetical protein QOG48_2001 [Verrucomicrobiota bacterium]
MLDKCLLSILRKIGGTTEREILRKQQCEKAADNQKRCNKQRDFVCGLESRGHFI